MHDSQSNVGVMSRYVQYCKLFFGSIHPIVVYSLLIMIWFSPFIFGQQVNFTRVPDQIKPAEVSFWELNIYTGSARYSDYLNQEVVETHLSIVEPRSGVFATWTDSSGFGRALFPHFGYTQTNFATWLSSLFSNNALVILTIRNLVFIYLAGLFLVLYGTALGFNRYATILAGFMYATQPMFTTWSTNMPFFVGATFGMGLVYGIHQLIYRPSFGYWVLVSLLIHLQITTSYLQTTVYVAYFIAIFFVILVQKTHINIKNTLIKLGIVMSATVIGIIASIPMIYDLYIEYTMSIRQNSQIGLPYNFPIEYPDQLIRLIMPGVYSNIDYLSGSYYNLLLGTHTTLPTFLLVLLAATTKIRQLYGWILMLLIAYVLSHNQTLHTISFSTIFPIISVWAKPFNWATLHIPIGVLMMWGIQIIFNRSTTLLRLPASVIIGLTSILLIIVIYVGNIYAYDIDWRIIAVYAIASLIIAGAMVIKLSHTTIVLMFIGMITTSVFVTFPTLYRAPETFASLVPTQYQQTLTTLESLDEKHGNVVYYDAENRQCCYVAGNQPTLYGISTIHLYKSSMSVYYINFIESLNGSFVKQKRNSGVIPDFDSVDFWMANAQLIVSDTKLNHPNLTYTNNIGRLFVYTNNWQAGCCLLIPNVQSPTPQIDKYDNLSISVAPETLLQAQTITKGSDQGDIITFTLQDASSSSLLVLSQIYHRQWKVQARVADGHWIDAATVVVNGKYQGVIIPPQSTALRMQFLPWSRLMWVFHGMWICLSIIWVIRRIILHKNNRPSGIVSA